MSVIWRDSGLYFTPLRLISFGSHFGRDSRNGAQYFNSPHHSSSVFPKKTMPEAVWELWLRCVYGLNLFTVTLPFD